MIKCYRLYLYQCSNVEKKTFVSIELLLTRAMKFFAEILVSDTEYVWGSESWKLQKTFLWSKNALEYFRPQKFSFRHSREE